MTEKDRVFEPIDIRKIASRFGFGKLPGFIYRRFEKLLHVKELNTFIAAHFDEEPSQFLANAVSFLNLKGVFAGEGLAAATSAEQPCLIVSNHPYGGAESTVCLNELYSHNPNTRLLAGAFYSLIQPLEGCCVFNKSGVRTLHDALYSGKTILMYPAAACSRKLSFKEIFDYEWKPGFVKMARKANIPVVVCHASGHNSNRFLNSTKVRRFFGIGGTPEASYLPDEMFRASGSTIEYTFSKPIDPSVFTKDVSDQEWADRIRQYCHLLRKDPSAVFDPTIPATLPKL